MFFVRYCAAPYLAALFVGAGACVRAQPAALSTSPFLPPASVARSGAQTLSSPYELTGTSTTSSGTEVCIFDKQAKSSHWIAIGSAFGDIRVVSYDPASDEAVITVHGSRMSLGLRKAVISALPGFAAAPVAIPISATVVPRNSGPPAQPQSPQDAERAKKEREARMLVSDLMDIGMQQRKAYEEAQKKEQQAQAAAKPN
jgi:hypothetical protein